MTSINDMPSLAGIHHFKYPVRDLDVSLRWWESGFGAGLQHRWDHRTHDGELFAYLLLVPGVPSPIELRLAPGSAEALEGFDLLTFGVDTHADLRAWADRLDERGIANSGVLRGIIGWLLVTTTPDGAPVRLHTLESHDWDVDNADIDSPWTKPLNRDQRAQ